MSYLITHKSRNEKTGPIMVTTSRKHSCPASCALRNNGCYAAAGPLGMLWRRFSAARSNARSFAHGRYRTRIHTLAGLVAAIEAQNVGALWRHNQAGDLAHIGGVIDMDSLRAIARANRKATARGFTYTHHDMTIGANRRAVAAANRLGFRVNLSADTLQAADRLLALNVAPVVVILPHDATANTTTPQGRKVIVCPATQRDDVTCADCGLCARARDFIIGFPAHGVRKKHVTSLVATLS